MRWRDVQEVAKMLRRSCNPKVRFVRYLQKLGCRLLKQRKWYVDIDSLPYEEYGISFTEWKENAHLFVTLQEWADEHGTDRFTARRLIVGGKLRAIKVAGHYYIYAHEQPEVDAERDITKLVEKVWNMVKRKVRAVPSFVRLGVSRLTLRKRAVLTILAEDGVLYRIGKHYFVWYDKLQRDPLKLIRDDPALLSVLLPYPSLREAVKEGKCAIVRVKPEEV